MPKDEGVDEEVERACIASMKGDVEYLWCVEESKLTSLAKSGFSALHYACACKRVEAVRVIMSRCGGSSAHVRANNEARTTVFQMCMFNGLLDMLCNGAFVSEYSSLYSEEELCELRAKSDPRISHWWMTRKERWECIVRALDADDVEAVGGMKCMGAEKNELGVCAMWCACAMGKAGIASAMLCHLRGRDLEEALFGEERRLSTCAFFMMLANGMEELCGSVLCLVPSDSKVLLGAVRRKSRSGQTCVDMSLHCSESIQRIVRSL